MKQPVIYIMTSSRNGTLYTGVTANLAQRVFQHRTGAGGVFTRKHGCKILVYYEHQQDLITAISREKQIKGGSRAKKIALIEGFNPQWRDLYEGLI